MERTNTNTKSARTLAHETASEIADFVFGALPAIGALAGIVGIFVLPLWYLARSLGVC